MPERKLLFGLIGTGAVAQTYAQAFEKCKTARVAGVADIRPDAARALAERLGCESFDSHEALSEGASLDAVVVSTPPDTHPEICIHFLKKKVHVLCEKPFSTDSRSARRMVEVAEQTGAQLTMASKFRFVDDVVRAKSIVESGMIGEIVQFENAFTSRVDMSSRWNSDPKISGGGVLIDNGTHSVDIARYFLGPLAAVQVVEGKRVQGLPVEDTVRIFVRSVSGVMGNIDLSWSINKELDSYVGIYGSGGTISIGWKESKVRRASSRDWTVFGKGYDKVQAFRSQIENFSGAILGKEPLLVTTEDALASLDVVEAAYAALRQNNWVPVNNIALGKVAGSSAVFPAGGGTP